MPESNYRKYIVSRPKQNLVDAPWSSEFTPERNVRVAFLDSDVVPGAFYVECVWIWPRKGPADPNSDFTRKAGTQAHSHDYDEVIAFFGTDFKNPQDLCGEVELWLGDEKQIITESSLVFVPKGLKHCPLIFRRVEKPIFHFTTGPGKMYF
jgi:hypothetical protein